MPVALLFYDVITSVHVMGVVVAFGALFAYPALVPWVRRNHPRAMPAVHRAQLRVDRLVIGPAMAIVLLAGIYLASDRELWDQMWVSIPMLILLIVGGMAGMLFIPTERRLAELADRDLEKGDQLGPEYDAALQRLQLAQWVAALLVLVAIFLMVAKP
jgi:small-conductance mechanosensitive channel